MKKLVKKYTSLPIQIKATFWFLVCSFLQKGISVITTPIFTRLLSTAEYGQFSVFNSWLSIITVFVTFNIYLGMYTRGLVRYEDDRKVYSSTMQCLCLTLVTIWTVIYLIFHDTINRITSLTTVQMLAMLLMIWATAAFNFWAAEQRVLLKYKTLVVITVVVSLAKPLLGILLVINSEDKVTARVLSLAIVELLAYTWCFFVQVARGKKFFSKQYWKSTLALNIPLIPHYLSMTVLNAADKIMIERMVGESEAGIYSLAYSLSMIMTMLNSALMQTMEPWLYKKINCGRIKDISQLAYPAFILVAVANLALIAFAPEAIFIFAPKEYHNAIYVIPPIAMSVFFTFSYTFFAVFEFYYKKTQFIAIATTAGAILNIVLNYIFIGLFGSFAAGYTTLACYMLYAAGHYWFMKKICKEELNGIQPYNIWTYLKIAAAFMGLGFALLITYRNIWVRYGLILALCIVGFIKRRWITEQCRKILMTRKNQEAF